MTHCLICLPFTQMLMDSLLCGRNIPTTLQSLACVGQYSVLEYDNIYEDITSYIYRVFQVSDKRCYSSLWRYPASNSLFSFNFSIC